MNKFDYIAQRDDCDPQVCCTVHILEVPENFRVTNALLRVTGLPHKELEAVFYYVPSSFQLPAWRLHRLKKYLDHQGCSYDKTLESATFTAYSDITGRCCAVKDTAPLWSELAFND